jgi:hypothetical protein
LKTKTIEPPNSLILVLDRSCGQVPQEIGANLVSATESCLAVGSRSDRPTKVFVGPATELSPPLQLVFDGELATPSQKLSILSVMNEEYLSENVSGCLTHVRVFANHDSEPDLLFIVIER